MTVEQVQRQGSTHRVADQVGLLQAEVVQQLDLLVHPDVQPSRRPLRWVFWMRALAVADKVRCQTVEPLAESGQGELPVGPRGGARSGALQKEDGLVVSLPRPVRSEEHTSELQSRQYIVCRLLLEKKKKTISTLPLSLNNGPRSRWLATGRRIITYLSIAWSSPTLQATI